MASILENIMATSAIKYSCDTCDFSTKNKELFAKHNHDDDDIKAVKLTVKTRKLKHVKFAEPPIDKIIPPTKIASSAKSKHITTRPPFTDDDDTQPSTKSLFTQIFDVWTSGKF
jgi:hypothetical protein